MWHVFDLGFGYLPHQIQPVFNHRFVIGLVDYSAHCLGHRNLSLTREIGQLFAPLRIEPDFISVRNHVL